MSITKGRTLAYIEQEWGTYVERFQRLPKAEQERRVREQGYERFRDMLAHILAWWEEGMGIILAIAEERRVRAQEVRLRCLQCGGGRQVQGLGRSGVHGSL
ncbi:MAG: hypothetical protein MZV64_00415 [Ignavibacteriales bacterium]|nr:hypothetical protein [Ignavibacteriales bacterium]